MSGSDDTSWLAVEELRVQPRRGLDLGGGHLSRGHAAEEVRAVQREQRVRHLLPLQVDGQIPG
jgi:hypothetical protein